jgi:hypothetical protein
MRKPCESEDRTIDAAAFWALAAPDVPQAARDEAMEHAETGERITRSGMSASFCQREDWVLLMPMSASGGDAVAACGRVAPPPRRDLVGVSASVVDEALD